VITVEALFWPRRSSSLIAKRARDMHAAGMTYADIVREIGIPSSTVRRWCEPSDGKSIRRDVPIHTHQASAGACGKATWDPAIPAAGKSVAGKPSAGNASSAVPLPRRW